MERVEELIKTYAAIDAEAEDILSDRQEIVELNDKRNKTREALRQLKQISSSKQKQQSWVCFANTFLKVDTQACMDMLEQDIQEMDAEIKSLQDGLKSKVAGLQKMEGHVQSKGFQLKGIRLEELWEIA
ncbi:hypothetical protein EMCRGX_G032294 [Ephydatia muelleri]